MKYFIILSIFIFTGCVSHNDTVKKPVIHKVKKSTIHKVKVIKKPKKKLTIMGVLNNEDSYYEKREADLKAYEDRLNAYESGL